METLIKSFPNFTFTCLMFPPIYTILKPYASFQFNTKTKILPFSFSSLAFLHCFSLFYTMEGNQLQRQAAYMRNALFDQGYLDEQFLQLEDLQDEANPNFVEEVVKLFYTDSARFIRNIEVTLNKSPRDFDKLDNVMHQFKGSSSSIGAKKVKKECTQFQEYCKVGNLEGCIRTFQEAKQEHATLRRKLESYFQLKRQAR